ncbi:MAG: hypothetical protein H9W81_04325 [Enterococcus sp.]|nr:hypothetical protein [Enterococcus sp.]
MQPYGGIEAWIWMIFVLLAALAITIILFAFKKEKQEKKTEDAGLASSLRKQKYGLFAGFFVLVVAGGVLGFVSQPISQNNYHNQMVAYVESNDVKLVEGFVDPQNPLIAGEHAKFVVETDSGLVRCRATAEEGKDVDFSCQDYSTEEKEFTVPLKDINENVKALTPEQVAEEDIKEQS